MQEKTSDMFLVPHCQAIMTFCTNEKVHHIVSNRQGPGRAQGPGMQLVKMEAVLAGYWLWLWSGIQGSLPAQLY